ncbi:hypothetical protein R1flu_010405 [Riccia fluitans]|uniref:Uncharacterized protein n=1 Tax=Riccia fluitans TaxID=41844 RepID=A0ABD1Z500_9MARC
MRQQVLPEHTQGLLGKKASSKTLKSDDFVDNGRRLVGDGFPSNEDKPSVKMPGGRIKGGSSTFHKDHKEHRDHKDTKDHKDHKDHKESKDTREAREHKEPKEHKDHSQSKVHEGIDNKAPESSENHAKEDEGEGQKRRAQEGERETLLQWGQRKRPRYREPPNGALKTSIRADRRVVRADKQIAAQPVATLPRGNPVRSSNGGTQEPVLGSGKRIAEGGGASGSAAQNCDLNHGQTSTGYLRSNVAEKDESRNHLLLTDNADKSSACPASTSGLNGATATPASTHGRLENESFQEKSQQPEKMNMDFFEWPKIVLGLTRKEKEDDFMSIKGTKLPQRPKRRPKAVEKNVNFISPGTWLCDLTRERYEVREKKAVKKKPRGLKAMGSVDSDSE